MSEYNIFKDVGYLSMSGPVTIKTGTDRSQNTTNVNPYTNHGYHAAAGGNISIHGEERQVVSAPVIGRPSMDPEPRSNPGRVQSAPVVAQPPEPVPLQPSRQTAQDDAKAANMFAELWGEALDKYKAKTGVDPRDGKNEFVRRFEDCEDSDVLTVLEDLPVFKRPGAKKAWTKIQGALRGFLDVVIVLNGLAAEIGNVAVPVVGKMIFVGIGLLLKTARDIVKQSETLEKLFSRLAAFLSRLEVRRKAGIKPGSRRIIIDILVELLNALAVATVVVKGKYWSKFKRFLKKLFLDEDEVDQSLSRLKDLTEQESAMLLAELAADRPDFKQLANEVGGLNANYKSLASKMRSVLRISDLENREFTEISSLLQSTSTDDRRVLLQVLRLLKINNDETEPTLNRIASEVQELRRSLVRNPDRNTTNGQAGHGTPEDSSVGGRMQDIYGTYVNDAQHITGGRVEIQEPQATVSSANSDSRQPVSPIPLSPGRSRDVYGNYINHGQHVTGGKVVIRNPRTNTQR